MGPKDTVINGVKWVIVDGIQRDGARVREAYRQAGIPVWIMELPRLRAGRASDFRGNARSYGLFLDSLHYLPPRIGNTAVTAGVIEDRNPEYILVCGQKPNDTAHGMDANECVRWAKETIALVRKQYGLPIVYRPHPQATALMDPEDGFGADALSRPATETLREALRNSYCLVSYNSTSGVEAIDAGVPVFYTSPEAECAYYQYAEHIGSKIRELTPDERETCLLRFAASQWTEDQLKDGTAVGCLFLGEEWPAPEIVAMESHEVEADRNATLGRDVRSEEMADNMGWRRKEKSIKTSITTNAITVIGHGKSPQGMKWGADIQEASPVLRMHDYGWQNVRDYGSRTDYIVWPGPWRPGKVTANASGRPSVAWLCYTFGRAHDIPAHFNGKPVIQIDLRWACERLSPFVPTRGTAGVLMAIALGVKTIRLVGFDSIRSGRITDYAKGAGWLKDGQKVGDRSNARHDYQAERELILSHAGESNVVLTFWGEVEYTADTYIGPTAAAAVAPSLSNEVRNVA